MDNDNIIPRMGTFFLIIGLGLIILFVASDLAETVYFDLFFTGVLSAGLGLYLRRRVAPPPPSGRFETWGKIRAGKYKDEQAQKRAQRQAENAAKKQSRTEERQAKKAARREKKNKE